MSRINIELNRNGHDMMTASRFVMHAERIVTARYLAPCVNFTVSLYSQHTARHLSGICHASHRYRCFAIHYKMKLYL